MKINIIYIYINKVEKWKNLIKKFLYLILYKIKMVLRDKLIPEFILIPFILIKNSSC